MPRGRAGRSPENTEGTVTHPASRGSSQRCLASVERKRLKWERERKMRELEDCEEQRQHELEEKERQRQHEETQRQHEDRQREHELEEKERQRQHELELERLRSSGPLAVVSEGGPRTARSFDKGILAQPFSTPHMISIPKNQYLQDSK
ncbi:hypothetical protein KIL84_009635 [Mauremys mutica]|uniref:Uncharacterized protein n=1 Tax=Mauremys mutica TaxID=74926 RepID=A0A9D3XLX5_9SAUR|nr:hypothetical protein KIL84_009635 [Mauremys mutica]